MHDPLNLPAQRRSPAGVLPVVAAVESVRYLREQLEGLVTATTDERDQLRHEIALLRQWLQCTETESGDYQATVDGLARFATRAEELLDEVDAHGAEVDGPGTAVPAVPC